MLRTLQLRWVHLLLGGALLMPYFLLMSVVVGLVWPGANAVTHLDWQFAAYGLSLPAVAATGLAFPLVRPLEAAAARALCAPGLEASGTDRSWAARRRTAGWFTLHVGVGGLVSGVTLAVPPMAWVLVVLPFTPSLRDGEGRDFGLLDVPLWSAPLIGVALLAALVAVAGGAGWLLARYTPALLGPTPADRLAAAEARSADLARRNALARELHDSVGHALSAVTLQASAARRVFDRDPEFVRSALEAIESATRDAVAELDGVLGVLRVGESAPGTTAGTVPGTTPAPTLARDLDGLLERTRAAGAEVAVRVDGDLGALPQPVSREAYRIIQEGLGNVLRHAGPVRVGLEAAVTEAELRVTIENDLREGAVPQAKRGGRGLTGIRERAALLDGSVEAGPYDGGWRLSARLPL